jgi:hypothetical protein
MPPTIAAGPDADRRRASFISRRRPAIGRDTPISLIYSAFGPLIYAASVGTVPAILWFLSGLFVVAAFVVRAARLSGVAGEDTILSKARAIGVH